jgi:hypothetical protein
VKESYAVQASERAAAALARRRKEMVTDRFMKGRIQGEGVKVKGLPVAGNFAVCDNFIQPPPGSARSPFGELVNRKELHMGNFEIWLPRRLRKFMQRQYSHVIPWELPIIQAKTPENGIFFRDNSRLFPNFPFRRIKNCLAPLHPSAGQKPTRPIGMLDE